MNKKDKSTLEEKILAKIESLKENIIQLKEQSKPISPENAIGRISRMDAINNKGVVEAALRNAERKLDGLENALERIDEESFGKCARCGTEMQAGRLLIMPESRYCVKCA